MEVKGYLWLYSSPNLHGVVQVRQLSKGPIIHLN